MKYKYTDLIASWLSISLANIIYQGVKRFFFNFFILFKNEMWYYKNKLTETQWALNDYVTKLLNRLHLTKAIL